MSELEVSGHSTPAIGRVVSVLRSRMTRGQVLLYGLLCAIYALFRIGSFTNIGDRLTDTPSYEQVARQALWEPGFWTGVRGFTIPLFFKIFHTTESRIVAQLIFSTLAWIVLAVAVARCLRAEALRPVAFGAILAFSLTTEIILWDTLLLSESVTFALTALLIAGWLELVRCPRMAWAAAVLVLSLLWAFARDTNAYVVLTLGVLVAVSLLRHEYRRLKLVLVVGCCVVFLLDWGSAQAGKRWLQPMKDIVTHRVLPNPGMTSFFVSHGFDPKSNWSTGSWIQTHSEHVYAEYLIEHPAYALFQPFYGHQEALYSSSSNVSSLVDPNLSIYNDNANHRFLTLPKPLERIFFPRGIAVVVALLVAVLLAAASTWRWLTRSTSWIVPIGILATTYPHFIVAWQQSGVEVDRHAFEAAMLMRLAMIMLIIFVADAVFAVLTKSSPKANAPTIPHAP